ncbi:MAG: hypothetical protein ACFFBS_05170 [Promethearchaeota archaeon]
MPRGIAIIGWDNNIGAVLEAVYPPRTRLEKNQTTVIYSMHTLSSRNPGFVALKMGKLNAASYYGGLDINKCLVVLLEDKEAPSIYREQLPRIMEECFNGNTDVNYDKELPRIYEEIVRIGKGGKTFKKIEGWF